MTTLKPRDRQFIGAFFDFLQAGVTPFHVVAYMAAQLEQHGFVRLAAEEKWHIQPGEKYYITRSDASIIAFSCPQNLPQEQGIRIIGAHTDSPGLKVKSRPDIRHGEYHQLGVEIYGSPLLSTWFDRELSIAGQVTIKDKHQRLKRHLIDFRKPIAVLPNLAIHLDRGVNEGRAIALHKELAPILQMGGGNKMLDLRGLILQELNKQSIALTPDALYDFDLFFYGCQPPALVGIDEAFICAGKLDNLLSCFVGLQAIIEGNSQQWNMLVCYDHEEVGSGSDRGAAGPFLADVVHRLTNDREETCRMLAKSIMISADNAHGWHPNFPEKHDGNHAPILNKGPVIKVNAQQRYATSNYTSSLFKYCCQMEKIGVQYFTNRSDLSCGSTIGPISASGLGIPVVDVGAPTFAMHSIRETAGCMDFIDLYRVFLRFYCQDF